MAQHPGENLSIEQLELRALKLDPCHRDGEAALMNSRWFDYRRMHPTMATYFFAECYRLETRRFYAAMVDERSAEECRAFTPDDIFFSRDLTAMWLARRFADGLGLPYPFVLRFARERFFSRTQHNFPRPNQLYGEELEQDLKNAWAGQLARQMTFATDPYFKAQAFKGDKLQVEHVKYVIKQIKARQAPHHKMLARLVNEGTLSQRIVEISFGAAVAAAAEAHRAQFM